MGRDGQLEKDKRVRLALGGAHGIRFQSDDQRDVPVLQRDYKGGRGVTLRGHDVGQVSVRQFRAQYLKEGRPAVGHRSDRPRLAVRIMKNQRRGDIGRGEHRHGRTARLQRHAHRACVQCRRHGQQGAVAFIRARVIFLYLPLIQRHHLPQTLFKQGLGVPRFFVRRVLGGFLFRLSENCVLFFGRRGGRFIRKRRSPGEDGQRQKAAYFFHDESLMCKRLWENQAHRRRFPYGTSRPCLSGFLPLNDTDFRLPFGHSAAFPACA